MTLDEFRAARSEQKRADILAAALDLFSNHGFGETSMELVARRSGVSTATLYRHFSSKTALFEAVAREAISVLNTAFDADGGPALSALAHSYSELLCTPSTRAIVRMLVCETGRGGDLADAFYTSIKSQISDVFARAVEQETGAARDAERLSHIAGQLQGMIEHSTLMRWLILGDDAPSLADTGWIAEEALKTWRARWAG